MKLLVLSLSLLSPQLVDQVEADLLLIANEATGNAH